MPWKAFGRSGGIQLGSGPRSQEPSAAQRPRRGGDEVSTTVHARAYLPSTAGHATRQVALCRHLGRRSGTFGHCSLQSCRRCSRSRSSNRHMFAQVARFRLLGLILRLLGSFHARSGPFFRSNVNVYSQFKDKRITFHVRPFRPSVTCSKTFPSPNHLAIRRVNAEHTEISVRLTSARATTKRP